MKPFCIKQSNIPGSVANRICASAVAISRATVRLRCNPEDLLDVMHLTEDVSLCQPPDLSLANHIHCLISRDGSQRSVDGSEPQAGGHALLHESVILLQHII